jgi:hypothetical protein
MSKISKIAAGIAILLILAIYITIHPFINYSVKGVIRDRVTNEPIAGAEVIIDQNSIITTVSGEYELDKVKKGFHAIRIEKTDYQPVSQFLNIENDLRKDVLLVKLDKNIIKQLN